MDTEEYLENLQAQQLSELTADFDYAFELQMQELVETSSAAAANLGAAQFLAEDMADYERARCDRDLAEAEASKLRENLNRMIHDQAFAREIHNVPETEWKNTGDNLERPYGEGSTTLTAGSFRVYSKGLVMETAGRDDVMKMRLGGVGIVICDMNDCPIFELRKPLDLGAIDGNGDGDMDVDVEFSAMMEGLNAAVTLGLKRVHVFSDNNLLHQNVTKKGPPRTNKIVTLVDHVNVLQQKFVSCNMSLVEQKEVRFAFKLARDTVVSQAIQLGKNMIETCTICTEDTDLGKIFSMDNCLHRYCFTCMKKHVEAKLLQGKLPECPHEGCKTEMKIQSCKTFLTPDLYVIMSQRVKEASIPATEKIYCPYPRCSALMSKMEVEGYAVYCSAAAQQAGARQCMTCKGFFCINCKVPWHANVTCFDYKRQNQHPSREDATLKNLATLSRWRQCRNCSHMVELAHGCYHIYCRCGHEFCYTCGAEWRNKKATCKCPIWDERNIVYD